MKTKDPEYRVAEIAVLIRIIGDARMFTQEAKNENRIGQTTDETREATVEALDELENELYTRLFFLARKFVPAEY